MFRQKKIENLPSKKPWKLSIIIIRVSPRNIDEAVSGLLQIGKEAVTAYPTIHLNSKTTISHDGQSPTRDSETSRACIHNMPYNINHYLAGWRSGSSLSLYSEYPRFETRSEHPLPWQSFFVVFLSLSKQILDSISIRPRPLHFKSFPIHHSPIILSSDATWSRECQRCKINHRRWYKLLFPRFLWSILVLARRPYAI
jgi:hypothetical protein